MLKDLNKVQDRVEDILIKYPECRDSDKLLWLAYNCIYNDLKENLFGYQAFKTWLLKNNIPMFESLSRARRKIQEHNKDLQGNIEVRREEEKLVKDWSLRL